MHHCPEIIFRRLELRFRAVVLLQQGNDLVADSHSAGVDVAVVAEHFDD